MVSHPAITGALAAWRVVRGEYQHYLEGHHQRADDDLAGNLLNKRGRRKGVDAYTLFYGPAVRVEAYASEELKAWFQENGRMNFEQYEAGRSGVTGRSWGNLIQDWDCSPE